MGHRTDLDEERGGHVRYHWQFEATSYALEAAVRGPAEPLEAESEAEFVSEHYWGYTRQRDGGTVEYKVEHPRWRVWMAGSAAFEGPAARLYGPELGAVLSESPHSAHVAVGSPVTVRFGRRIA